MDAELDELPQPKPLRWIASSRADVHGFPREVRREVGQALFDAQCGEKHSKAKPLKGFTGASVLEVVESFDGDAYRVVYTVRFSRAVYVLHAFQKKSKGGSKTPPADVKRIKLRLAQAEVHYAKWLEEQT